MGALHEGHLSLIRQSLAAGHCTLASIFVNPLQFGPTEDLSRYPRPLERDLELLEQAGAHAVFVPSVQEMYPADASTFVIEERVSEGLCGTFRPGHFRGVATVVLKLLNLVQPDFAYFGQKDAQQCAVIERLVRDLEVPVQIIRGETVREKDGLALSSRNAYLSAPERALAPRLYESLQKVRDAWMSGERRVATLEARGKSALEAAPGFRLQYLEVRSLSSLERPVELQEGESYFVAVAAYLGTTRLIDNLVLSA
jgi:pantoate--beta-alanine ligase